MQAWQQIKEHKVRFILTCSLYYSLFLLGLIFAIPGPSLIDLSIQVDVELGSVAYILTARSAGHAVGTFACKYPNNYADPNVRSHLCTMLLWFTGK